MRLHELDGTSAVRIERAISCSAPSSGPTRAARSEAGARLDRTYADVRFGGTSSQPASQRPTGSTAQRPYRICRRHSAFGRGSLRAPTANANGTSYGTPFIVRPLAPSRRPGATGPSSGYGTSSAVTVQYPTSRASRSSRAACSRCHRRVRRSSASRCRPGRSPSVLVLASIDMPARTSGSR